MTATGDLPADPMEEPWWSDPARRTVATAPVCAPLLAGWAIISDDPAAWLALALYAILVGSRLASRLRRCPARSELAVAVGRRRCREALGALPRDDWIVLPGRLVPGYLDHVAHIVIGPPGVVLVTAFVGEGPGYPGWWQQRLREVAQLQGVLAIELGLGAAPVRAVAAGTAGWPRHGRMTLDGVVVCSVEQLVPCLVQLSAVLPPAAVVFLGDVADKNCLPAPRPAAAFLKGRQPGG